DAKVSFDNNALFRHPDLMELRDTTEEDEKEIEAKTEHKPPAKPPAANATPPNKAPANVPKPVVVTEDKPPSFPVGLEEKSDEDGNKSAREKDDGKKDEEKDNKQE
ncbi:hypothetical protein EN829_055155, partial [Mesorhizobium sp. M00.F.Ca.ET.186.01.1.1]